MKPKVSTPIPGPKSTKLVRRMLKSIGLANYAGLYGIVMSKGQGCYLTDIDGNTYLDFISGASNVILGYGRTEVIKAYADQANKIQHSCFVYSPNKPAVELAEKLIQITPGKFPKKVLFGLSGSSSIDAAIKAARRYTNKPGIIAFRNAYHGNTGLSLQANGFPGLQKGLFLGKDFYFVDFPTTSKEANKTLKTIEKLLKNKKIAAFITEAVQGDGGNKVPPIDFHKKLINLVHRYKAVYVVDEIQSGAGRSGRWWEISYFGVDPDILVCGKGIASGYAILSACIGRQEIIDSLDKAQHVFTYQAHDASCAAVLKVLKIIEKEKLRENAAKMGNLLISNLQSLVNSKSCAREVRGFGLHLGFEVRDRKTNKPLGGLFGLRLVEKGLYPGYFGANNEALRLHPPLIINKQQILWAAQKIAEVVHEWDSGKFPKETVKKYSKVGLGLGTD
jgi:4-aminobutyrate aminotransferase